MRRTLEEMERRAKDKPTTTMVALKDREDITDLIAEVKRLRAVNEQLEVTIREYQMPTCQRT